MKLKMLSECLSKSKNFKTDAEINLHGLLNSKNHNLWSNIKFVNLCYRLVVLHT